MPSRAPPGSDSDESLPIIRQLEDDIQAAANSRQDLEARYGKLHKAFLDATAKESEARAQVQKLLQGRQEAEKYITGLHNRIDELGRCCHESQRAKQGEEAEVDKLRRQLITFKSNTTIHTNVSSQATDEEVRQRMDMIYYATQDFAVTALRGAPLGTSVLQWLSHFADEAAGPSRLSFEARSWLRTHLLSVDVPPKSCWPTIVVSIVARVLVESFTPEYYFGISLSLPVHAAMALASNVTGQRRNITGFLEETDLPAVDMVADAKSWLEPTRNFISRLDETALLKSDQALVDRAIKQLHSMMAEALRLDWVAADAGLRKIFGTAFELFRALHRSKALFHIKMTPVVLPGVSSCFQIDSMTAVSSAEDERALIGRLIEVSVFPGIYKFGNELGENVSTLVNHTSHSSCYG